MKCLILLSLVAIASSQTCSHQATTGGGDWKLTDFPYNATTQDFNRLNRSNWRQFKNIPNTVQGEVLFNQIWLNQTETTQLSNDPRIRVEGFKYGKVTPHNAAVPCITIKGSPGYGVEIMVYAMSDITICIREAYNPGGLNTQDMSLFDNVCDQQRLRHCFIGPTDRETKFEIYIKSTNPPEYDIPVWYRVRRSQFDYATQGSQASSGNTEMWCQMVSGSVETSWPEFIGDVPINGVVLPRTGAAPSVRFVLSIVVAVAAALFA